MNKSNVSLLIIALILLTGVFAVWLWFFQPDCYVTVDHVEERTHLVKDTAYTNTPCKIIGVQTSDIQAGKRPRVIKDVVDKLIEIVSVKLDQGQPTETYYYVCQHVTLQNVAIDSVTCTAYGWVLLAVLPEAPVKSSAQSLRLAPGETATFRFVLELPPGYDYEIVAAMNEENVHPQASRARVVTDKLVTEQVVSKRRCNQCRDNCGDDLPDAAPQRATFSSAKATQ